MEDIDERHREINVALSLIHNICKETNISLIPKKIKGEYCVIIYDYIAGKEYVIIENKETQAD